jgi:excisionase family DNA binding protein
MASLMTENEVSKRLNVSVASLRRWRLLSRGPAFVKVGSLVRYSRADLEAWLASLPMGGSMVKTPRKGQEGRKTEGQWDEEGDSNQERW